MKFTINILLFSFALLVFYSCEAQITNAKTETRHVYGNCGMCEKTIEKAAFIDSEAKADWDQDTKMAQITFDSTKTSADAILQRIAEAGYDSDQCTAPDAAYQNLQVCCQYDRPIKMAVVEGIQSSEGMKHPADTLQSSASIPTEAKMIKESTSKPELQEASPLTKVYVAYFDLKNALVSSDASKATVRAEILSSAIKTVNMEQLTPEKHAIWMKYQPKLIAEVEKIKETRNLKQQRESFALLSKNIYEVMKVIKPEVPVYYDYCPMYNDGKGGNWLSTEKAIQNPFYGKQMLNCGSVVETIK